MWSSENYNRPPTPTRGLLHISFSYPFLNHSFFPPQFSPVLLLFNAHIKEIAAAQVFLPFVLFKKPCLACLCLSPRYKFEILPIILRRRNARMKRGFQVLSTSSEVLRKTKWIYGLRLTLKNGRSAFSKEQKLAWYTQMAMSQYQIDVFEDQEMERYPVYSINSSYSGFKSYKL